MKFYVGQKLKYAFNVNQVIDNIIVLNIHKIISKDFKCGFHNTNQKFNRATQCSP